MSFAYNTKSVSLIDAVEFFNELLQLDQGAVTKLLNIRAPLDENSELISHPSVQVRLCDLKQYSVGLVGVLNGLFGDENYRFAACYVLECSNGCVYNNRETIPRVGEMCIKCGSVIVLGDLIGFEAIKTLDAIGKKTKKQGGEA